MIKRNPCSLDVVWPLGHTRDQDRIFCASGQAADHISQQIIGQALPDVITGKKPAKQALDGTVKDIEDVVRKAGWLKS